MDIGFEVEMQQILRLLPKKRQSMLFSATVTSKVTELVKSALNTDPIKIGLEPTDEDDMKVATVEGLQQVRKL